MCAQILKVKLRCKNSSFADNYNDNDNDNEISLFRHK